MHDLRLVGVHDDGEHLVLTDAAGERFRLAADDALRAAVRRDRAHLGQLQIEIGGGPRPKEIQSRIRAGSSAEEVAEATGWPLDKIQRYESPVLAERAHVAELAQAVRLRRRAAEQVTLGAEVTGRLIARDVDPERAEWDAWRTESGPWTVLVRFEAGGRPREARWHFDVSARSVTPADDEARWLSEQVPSSEGPLGGGRLAAVPAGVVYDVDADGGVPMVDDGGPLDLMSAMRTRRADRVATSRRRPPATSPGPKVGTETNSGPADVPGARHPARRSRPHDPDAVSLDPALLADPPAAHPPASVTAGLVEAEEQATEHPDGGPALAEAAAAAAASGTSAGGSSAATTSASGRSAASRSRAGRSAAGRSAPRAPAAPSAPPPTMDGSPADPDDDETSTPRHRVARTRNRRASVPSWDDIMFGTKRE
jgi:hypothetical protein